MVIKFHIILIKIILILSVNITFAQSITHHPENYSQVHSLESSHIFNEIEDPFISEGIKEFFTFWNQLHTKLKIYLKYSLLRLEISNLNLLTFNIRNFLLLTIPPPVL